MELIARIFIVEYTILTYQQFGFTCKFRRKHGGTGSCFQLSPAFSKERRHSESGQVLDSQCVSSAIYGAVLAVVNMWNTGVCR